MNYEKQRLDDKTIKEKEREYIHRILYGTEVLKQMSPDREPVVFMSKNICDILKCGADYWAISSISPGGMTVCKYKLKLLFEPDLLYVGYEI